MVSITRLVLLASALLSGAAVPSTRAQPPPVPPSRSASCPHGIDGTACPFCDPSRVERLGTCEEHGVPEALCVECRPFLKAAFVAAGDWCTEHDTPESQCRVCNPASARDAAARARSAGADLRWQQEPSLTCSTSAAVVTLASPAVVRAVGFEYAQVRAAPLTRTVERDSELAYNATRYARLSSRAAGVVAEVVKDLGETAERGDVLAVVESTDVGSAKSDLLQALELVKLWEANATRERALVERGVGVEREALEAETKAAESRIGANRARQRLRNFGLSKEHIEAVERDGDTSSLLQLRAPFGGTIVERAVVTGELVEPGRLVVAVADTGTMWAMVDLSESDMAVVQPGQQASVTVDGLPGRTFAGRLTWISTQVDPRTRTVKARVELDNGQGVLRANMFGRARISAGDSRRAVTVPKEAVQWEGCCNVAFVRGETEGTTFRPARLVLLHDAGDRYEVAGGLEPGDTIVTRGSYILKNEILKNAVGAGCCEVDYLKK
ncbi:MAG: efflux RND transporter periplasmic adaptor subunit [Phycisphaerae bacterium]|nr:efflux RND transporter periplasmic adaptor subunit [Phycisphaerae bacterium]